MDDIATRYQHLIGKSVDDGTHGVIASVEVFGPKLVKATTTDGTVVDVTPFAKEQ
jgi:hypothetical protein